MAAAAAALLLSGCSSGSEDVPVPDGPRAQLLSALRSEQVARGVYVLEPDAEEYPGSPFDVLVPTDGAHHMTTWHRARVRAT